MGKNNQQKMMMPEQRNFKLYKAKKQWITACATFLVAFGVTTAMNVNASADANSQVGDSTSETTKVTNTSVANSFSDGDVTATTETAKKSTGNAQTLDGRSNSSSQKAILDNNQQVVADNSNQGTTTLNTTSQTDTAKNAQTATESKAATENIAPIQWKDQDGNEFDPYVVAGTNLKDDLSELIPNSAALKAAGAKITLESVINSNGVNITNDPTITQKDAVAGVTYDTTLKITYADGTVISYKVTLFSEPQAVAKTGTFYYVPEVGAQVTNLDTPDVNGRKLINIEDPDNSIIDWNELTGKQTDITAKLVGSLDTSKIGIHYAEVEVTDNNSAAFGLTVPNNGLVLGKRTYTIKIPYVVKGLALRTDIPTDADGNPVINAQLATDASTNVAGVTRVQQAFDPTKLNDAVTPWGQYFYQDYDKAIQLGIRVSATNWTNPTDLTNAKTNNFTMVLSDCGSAEQQKVAVNYVTAPKVDTTYFYNSKGTTYGAGRQQNLIDIKNLAENGNVKSQVIATVLDQNGKEANQTASNLSNVEVKNAGSIGRGKFATTFDAHFNQTNDAGQPLIWANWNTTNANAWGGVGTATWNNLKANAIALAPSVKTTGDKAVKDVSDGEFSESKSVQDYQNFLAGLVANPKTQKGVKTADGKNWTGPVNQFGNTDVNPVTGWPEGSTFAWIGKDGATSLTLKKAGEKKTGDVKITLPSGSTFTVKDITVVSKAEVRAQSETVDYGTVKSAADLVTNKDAFPAGTTFQFVASTEPNWKKSGSYKNVQITATYNGYTWDKQTNAWVAGPITTDPADCAVAINDTRNITILQGTDVPTLSSILNFAPNWEAHTASWTKDINTNSTNQGEITVHYPASNLDQVIKVFVTVIPKDSAVNGTEFKTNGSKFDGTTGSIAPGTENQGAILTKDNGAAVSYDTYNKSGVQGEPSTFKQEPTSYTPTYSLTGLKTNKDGSLVSGPQTVTVHVTVPNGTIGASVDSDGNSEYALTSNIIVAQPVTFEFVDDNDNGKVVSSQSGQEFIKGQSTKLSTPLTIPTNYQLVDGQSQDSLTTYTLPDYSKDPVIVQIHLVHQTDTVDPNTPTTNPTSDPNWFKTNNLVKDATRTINYVDENGKQLTDPTIQTIEFTRTATYDKVTGQVVKGSEGSWTTKSDSFAAVTPPTIDKMGVKSITDANGQSIMTADGQVPAVDKVSESASDSTVTVTYVSGQNVTFEFVDTYNNDAVIGKSYDQFLIYGKDTKLDFTMTMPEGQEGVYSYVLADGQSIPSSYTLTESSPTVVKIGIHQSMHFNIAFHDDDENKTLYTATVPTANAGNGGYYITKFPNGTFPQGVTAGSYYSVSVDAPEGTKFTGDNRVPLTNPSAGWTVPNFSWDKTEAVEKALTGATITIHLKHRTEELTGNSTIPTGTKTEDGALVTKADFSKTFTRTITEYLPAAAGQENKRDLSQNVTLTRTGVRDMVTGILTWNAYNTGNFAAVAVTSQAGYTTSITQQIGQEPATVISSIDELPVDINTMQPINIVIRYGATATAELSGNGKSTYNGSPITVDDLNKDLKVTVTGPTATSGAYSLKSGDVEFSTDGQTWTTDLPTNAATYQVRLTAQGEQGIQDQFGNNSIVWARDGKSTITSNASWTIDKLTTDSVMNNAQAGNYSQTYNGIAPSSIDPSKFAFTTQVNGNVVTLTANDLTSGDFTWVDGTAPVNVGTYKIKLTDAGLAKLQSDNPNFTLTNTGEGTFTITQADATAVLSGSGTRAYNGSAVTVDDLNVNNDGNNITLTLHYPKDGNASYSTTVKLSDGDYTWNTPNGKAPVNANDQAYTLTLNPDAVQKLIQKAVGAGQNGQSNVKFADGAISGSASYKITPLASKATLTNTEEGNYSKVYDDQTTDQIDATKLQLTAVVNGKTVVLNTDGIDGNSYQWVNATGNALKDNPKNVGTYYIKLTSDAFKTLQADNPNFTLSNSGLGVYKITQANATATLSGSNSKVYDGQAITVDQVNDGSIKVDLSFPGANDATYTLQSGDYTISGNATDAGDYTITLTDQGIANIENSIKSLAGNGQQNQSNVTFAENAITGNATFTIEKSKNVVSVGGTQTATYNGSPINVVYNADGTNSVTVSITRANGNTTGSTGDLTKVTLASGDFTVVGGPAENAGSYQVALTDTGLQKIQQALGDNFAISVDANTTGTLQIDKYKGNAVFTGNPVYAYTGEPVSATDYLKQYSIKLKGPNNPTYQFVPGDLEFHVNGNWTTVAPVNAGTYQVRVSQQGWNNIKKVNSENVEWSATSSSGTGMYTIKAAEVTTELSGKNSLVYTGNAVTTADLYAGDSTIQVAINGKNISNLPASFKLDDGDYEWVSGSAPMSVGNYQLKLTQSGLDKIQKLIDSVVGLGNVTLVTNPNDGGTADFEITQAVANNVQLYGNEQSTYSGKVVDFDPTSISLQKNYGFHNIEGLNIPQLTSADFEWVDKDGNAISTPVNKGTYYLQLNDQGKQAIANANPNYSFADGKISGEFTYTINPVNGTATLSGQNHKTYDGKAVSNDEVISPSGTIKVTLTFPGSDTTHTYVLQEGDYVWNVQNPTNVGTYTLTLTKTGLVHMQQALNQFVGAGNVNLTADGLMGHATFTIDKKPLVVTLTDHGTTPAGKTYDGQAAAINPQDGRLTADGLVTGDSLNTAKLTDADYEWVDADGNKIAAPTEAGTYYVALNANGLKQLQKDNPNYDITEQGRFRFVISPANAHVTITGQQESTNTEIDSGKFNLNVPNGITVPAGLTYQFASGNVPTESGTYPISLTPASLATFQQANPNYKLNISSTAEFTLDATLTVIFQDTNEDNQQVGQAITKTGVADSTINLGLTIPENYVLAQGEKPLAELNSYTFGKDLTQSLYIKLAHKTVPVDPTDPSTNPDPKNENWFKEHDLVTDVTRTINYTGLSNEQLGQIPADQKSQSVHFTRTAQYDLITGQLVQGSEGAWTPATQSFAGFTPMSFDGYKADKNVPTLNVSGDSQDSTITVNYEPTMQSGKIAYVDKDGHEVGHTPLTGQTGTAVKVTPVAPQGWTIVPGQKIPETVTATSNGIPTVTVEVQHQINAVLDTKTVVRDIVITFPDGHHEVKEQTATIERTVTTDLATGKVTYGKWSQTQLDRFVPQKISADPSEVAALNVTADTPAAMTVMVNHTKNGEPTPDNPVTPDHPVNPDQPITPSNPGGNNERPGQNGNPGGQIANGNVTHIGNGQATSAKAAQHTNSQQLPQTGNTANEKAVGFGFLFAGLSTMFGLLGAKKKKED